MKQLLIFTMGMILLGSVSATAASYDYGDAPGYAMIKHSYSNYQRLGNIWDAETAPKADDASDDGVFWSIDDGTSWGHDVITAGSTVTFRFSMYKQMWGDHTFDALRACIDFNNDKDFTDSGELIKMAQWNFTQTDSNIDDPLYYSKGINYTSYQKGDYTADITKYIYQDVTFATSLLGDYWLRARVGCNGIVGQGEVEDWKLVVVNNPANPVPEPATMLLLGTGLAGLITRRKIKK